MTTDDDNWVKSAMEDNDLVAHLLSKLRHASPSPPPKTWTIRQRRSKPPPPPPPASVKKSPAARASPTTPLSWSGATSVSGGGGGGGVEESSRPIHDVNNISRSKVIGPNETTPTKRPRKKKTVSELRLDVGTLLIERKELKVQLAALQAAYQKHREENESLKKMKSDLQSQQVELAESKVNDRMEEKKSEGFVLPDLNIPADGDF